MDQHDNRNQPYALKADEGWTYRFGIDFTVKAGEVQKGSGAAFLEYVTRKGEEPPSHTHATENEMFYVLEGAVTFRCGDESFDLEKGGFIFLPRGVEHSYRSGQGRSERRMARFCVRYGNRSRRTHRKTAAHRLRS